MTPHLDELQKVLVLLIGEHRKVLAETDRHQTAVKAMNVPAMELSRTRQEALRQAIALLENRRRLATDQIALAARISAPTITQLAELNPHHRLRLLALRDELRDVLGQITQKTTITARVTGAVLGHLNTVVRLMAGAMQQAGVYTKHGVPKLAPRIGAIEAIG